VEYARNVLGIADADHAEYDPNTRVPLIALVSCPVLNRAPGAPSLSGALRLSLTPGSLAARVYGADEAAERFGCNYELNPAFQERFDASGLRVTARGDRLRRPGALWASNRQATGEARMVELPTHRFFVATLFLPQYNSTPKRPHPLIAAFLRAAAESSSAG